MKRKKNPAQVQSVTLPQSPQRLPVGILAEIATVMVLAGIPFALGKYFEFNQPDPFDGGAYAYSAWHVLQGAQLGKEEIISAQPATFMMNYIGVAMCGFSELGPELVQAVLQLAALGMIFYTLRKCFGKASAILSTAIAAIYISAPVISKFGNVKEQFMLSFMSITACFVLLAIKTQKEWLWAIVGIFTAWPYYFKPTGLSILAATGLCIVLFSILKRSWTLFLNRLLYLSCGIIAGISPLLLFFYRLTGKPMYFKSLPVLLVKAVIGFAILGYAVIGLVWINKRFGVVSRLRKVHPMYWIAAAAAIVLAYAAGAAIVRVQSGAIGEDIYNYLYATPFFKAAEYLYYSICGIFFQLWKSLGSNDIYLSGSRALMGFSQQAPIVLRYYLVLKLPVTAAVVSLVVVLVKVGLRAVKKIAALEPQDWMAIFLATWWIFDMGMIWISPRSYEQYYLPMCASAAVFGGYGMWEFMKRFNPAQNMAGKFLAPAAFLIMTGMVFPIFIGITHSPFSGTHYKDSSGQDIRSRGYVQSWESTRARLAGKEIGPWEKLGDYIRANSTPEDRIYVWGWFPGIYVRAQRFSSSAQAFEGNMHIFPPQSLAYALKCMLEGFAQHPPKFIVDSRKKEFPWTVPPLELWPQVPKELQGDQQGFLSTNPVQIKRFEVSYAAFLAKQVSTEEARRFETMKPFRDYVMQNYRVVGMFGQHVLFVRKATAESK